MSRECLDPIVCAITSLVVFENVMTLKVRSVKFLRSTRRYTKRLTDCFICLVDRARVIGGLPDVVTIQEGKVIHLQLPRMPENPMIELYLIITLYLILNWCTSFFFQTVTEAK